MHIAGLVERAAGGRARHDRGEQAAVAVLDLPAGAADALVRTSVRYPNEESEVARFVPAV